MEGLKANLLVARSDPEMGLLYPLLKEVEVIVDGPNSDHECLCLVDSDYGTSGPYSGPELIQDLLYLYQLIRERDFGKGLLLV